MLDLRRFLNLVYVALAELVGGTVVLDRTLAEYAGGVTTRPEKSRGRGAPSRRDAPSRSAARLAAGESEAEIGRDFLRGLQSLGVATAIRVPNEGTA